MLAFPQVAPQILAVLSFVSHEVEDVVLDLECDAEGDEYPANSRDVAVAESGYDSPDHHRSNKRVPAGLFVDQPNVVGIHMIPCAGGNPPQFEHLAFSALARHAGDRAQHLQRLAEPDPADVFQ